MKWVITVEAKDETVIVGDCITCQEQAVPILDDECQECHLKSIKETAQLAFGNYNMDVSVYQIKPTVQQMNPKIARLTERELAALAVGARRKQRVVVLTALELEDFV